MKKLLTILVLLLVVLFTGCKKDDYKATVGVCPVVVSTIPLDKAVNVPLNQVVSATFNEAMNPATITASAFTLTGTTTLSATVKAASVVTGTVTYSGMTATFTPATPLLAHTTYTGKIATTVKDLTGNALQVEYTWSFSTDVAPTIVANPLDNSVDVALNKIIIATFSAPMDTLTLKAPATTVTVKQGTTLIPGKYSYTSTTASFTPDVPLTPFTAYTVAITTAAKNALGTPLAADFIWDFTTIPQLTVSSLPVLGGTVTGGGTFAQGSSVTVTAVPILGYSFVNWKDGATVVSTTAGYTFNMAGNKTLVANFAIATYTLTVTAIHGTVVKVPNQGSYNSGATVTLTATPAVGYVFASWTGDASVSTNPLTVTMNANKNITANFTAIGSTFTLDVATLHGTVVKNPDLPNYSSGAVVTITPTPATGYVFSSWSGDATGSANPLKVTVIKNTNITANFTAIPVGNFSLNIIADHGNVTKNPDQLTYNNGSIVVLTATPDDGYVFSSWSVDASGSVSPTNVTMNANKNVTANFILAPAKGPGVVNLGTAMDFTSLAKTGISTTGVTSITGNIGVSPAEATYLTGFALTIDASGQFSTSPYVIGKVYAPAYAAPTPVKMTTAVSDMETAFTTANGLTVPAPIVNIYAGDISGRILPAGLYKWSTDVIFSNEGVTLSGGPNDTWVFQIAQDLVVANGAIVTLSGGAQAKNIFWVVTKQTNLGTGVDFSGNILGGTLISLNTGSKVTGKLLAQTAVTLNAATVVEP